MQWSEQVPVPERDGPDGPDYFGPPHSKVRYDAHPTTSIQNRFDVRDITTTAVFHVDDDVRIPCATLARAHAAWKSNRDAVVGFTPPSASLGREKVQARVRVGRRLVTPRRRVQRRAHQSRVHAHGISPIVRRSPSRGGAAVRGRAKKLRGHRHAARGVRGAGAAPVYVPVPALRYWWDKLAGFGVAGISKGGGTTTCGGRA